MTFSQTKINHGGLFRCCLESVDREVSHAADCKVLPGTVHTTTCCKEPVVLGVDGVWRWRRGDSEEERESCQDLPIVSDVSNPSCRIKEGEPDMISSPHDGSKVGRGDSKERGEAE